MDMTLAKRIEFVRKNLAPKKGKDGRRVSYLTLDEFALAVGAADRHGPMAWEKGRTPRDYAERIARLTPYPAAAVGGDGAEDLFRETVGSRLRELEEKVAQLAVRLDEVAGVARATHVPSQEKGNGG